MNKGNFRPQMTTSFIQTEIVFCEDSPRTRNVSIFNQELILFYHSIDENTIPKIKTFF